jgi:hypothetical protein
VPCGWTVDAAEGEGVIADQKASAFFQALCICEGVVSLLSDAYWMQISPSLWDEYVLATLLMHLDAPRHFASSRQPQVIYEVYLP